MLGLYWHIDRWRKSTAYSAFTAEEQGVYRNLLDEQALRGGVITADEDVLAAVACRGDKAVWKRVRTKVLARFEPTEGGLANRTLSEVLTASQKRIDRQQRYRDRVAAERNEQRNESVTPTSSPPSLEHHNRDNERRYPYQDQDVQEQEPPSRQAVPGRRARGARPAGPPAGRDHSADVEGFCGWVCLPVAFVEERRATAGQADIVAWAQGVRQAFADVPVDRSRPFDFWRARWAEATQDVTPTAQEAHDFQTIRRANPHGTAHLTLHAFVLARRRQGHPGPFAPALRDFLPERTTTS